MNFLKKTIDLPYFDLDLRSAKKQNVFPGKKILVKMVSATFLEKKTSGIMIIICVLFRYGLLYYLFQHIKKIFVKTKNGFHAKMENIAFLKNGFVTA